MSPSDPHKPDDHYPPAAEPVDDDLPTEILGPDAVIDLGDLATADDGGSGSIPLANLPDPPSGQSLTSWTEVIRRQRAASGSVPPKPAAPVVDAPSDHDLLSRMDDESRPGDTSEIRPGDLPVVGGHSASEIDLGRLSGPGPGGPASSSEVGFDILYPPSDAGGAMRAPPPADYPPLTEDDFAEAAEADDIPFAAEATGDSFAGLGDDPPPGPAAERSSILDVLLNDPKGSSARGSASDILAYGHLPTPPTPPAPPRGRPSSHDHVAPAPPSGWLLDEVPDDDDRGEIVPESRPGADAVVDLYNESPHRPPSLTDSGSLDISEEAIEEARRRSELMESSSVDLSSRPNLLESRFDLNSQSGHEVDLDLPPVAEDGSSSMVYPRQAVRENQEALEAEFEDRRRRGGGAEPPRPARRDEARAGGGGQYLLRGTVLGLLLGVGGTLGAYFGGLLPNGSPVTTVATGGGDTSAEVAQLKKDVAAARAEAADAKAKGADPAELALVRRTAADAVQAEQAAKAELATATTAAADAKKDLAESMKAVQAAQAEAVAAKKELTDATTGLTKVFKDAGLDAAKPAEAIKTLVDARTAAEAKEKETAGKVAEAEKKAVDAGKLAETAKKSADDAVAAATEAKKAQEAGATTLAALADRLTKAKFVGEKADGPALVKGVEDALKAAGTDATAALRDELAKTRDAETKAKTDLTAAREKETAASKAAQTAKDEAQKLADVAKAAEMKAAAEAAKVEKLTKDLADAGKGTDEKVKVAEAKVTQLAKELADAAKGTDEKVAAATKAAAEKADKLSKDLAAATKATDEKVVAALKDAQDKAATETAKLKADADKAAKAAEVARLDAEKAAAEMKAAEVRATTETAKLKTENDRLAKELDAVKELAAAIRAPGATVPGGPPAKPDAGKIADRHFGDALADLYRGRTAEAESGFRKAIQFQPDDARFHYLLGVALWSNGSQKEAEGEFKKGQELELANRPDRRAVSAALERIQGPARQAVNAYRP